MIGTAINNDDKLNVDADDKWRVGVAAIGLVVVVALGAIVGWVRTESTAHASAQHTRTWCCDDGHDGFWRRRRRLRCHASH
jgi:hypothetical protein